MENKLLAMARCCRGKKSDLVSVFMSLKKAEKFYHSILVSTTFAVIGAKIGGNKTAALACALLLRSRMNDLFWWSPIGKDEGSGITSNGNFKRTYCSCIL